MNKISSIEIQKEIMENKAKKGFNISSVDREICLLIGELGEFFEAFRTKKDIVAQGEELADVEIHLLSIAEMINVDLGEQVQRKIGINKRRMYEKNDKGTLVKGSLPM